MGNPLRSTGEEDKSSQLWVAEALSWDRFRLEHVQVRCRDKNHNFDRRKMSEQDICRLQQIVLATLPSPSIVHQLWWSGTCLKKRGWSPCLHTFSLQPNHCILVILFQCETYCSLSKDLQDWIYIYDSSKAKKCRDICLAGQGSKLASIYCCRYRIFLFNLGGWQVSFIERTVCYGQSYGQG